MRIEPRRTRWIIFFYYSSTATQLWFIIPIWSYLAILSNNNSIHYEKSECTSYIIRFADLRIIWEIINTTDSHYDVAQFYSGLYEGACLVIRSRHRASSSPVPRTSWTARMRYRRGALPSPYAHVPSDHAAQHGSAVCKTHKPPTKL